jgi:hypothetical protein
MPYAPMRDRQLFLGRLRFVTHKDDTSEQLGGGIDSVGSYVALAERAPRPVSLTLPVRALAHEGDERELGERLRRQVRAALNNDRLRAQGFFLYSEVDPELTGWYLVGGGDLTYENGGPTFGEYSLQLRDATRLGALHTHREGRRGVFRNIGATNTTVDYLGRRYGAGWTQLGGSSHLALPPMSEDVRASTSLLPRQRGSKAGPMPFLLDMTPGDVVTFEQNPAAKAGGGDVRIFDRRGGGDQGHELAHPYGQRSTIPANVFPNPFPRRSTHGWSATTPAYFLNAAATPSLVGSGGPAHGPGATQQEYMRAQVSAAGNPFRGLITGGRKGWTFRKGRNYRFSIRVNLIGGSNDLQLFAGTTSANSVFVTINPTASWQPIYTVDWTPTGDVASENVYVGVRTGNHANASDFGLAHLAVMDVTDIPVAQRPQYALYNDGNCPGCTWNGAPNASATVYSASRVNLVINPQPQADGGQWAQTGLGVIEYQRGPRARRPTQPWMLRLASPQNTDPYAYSYSWNWHAPGDALIDQTFRMQGQRMVLSAYRRIDAPLDSPPVIAAGVIDRLLLWYDGAASGGTTASAAAQQPPGQWVREVAPFTHRAAGYSNLDVRLYNPYDDGVAVDWTDVQLEFSLDGKPSDALNGTDPHSMYVSGNGMFNGYTVEDDPERLHEWEQVFGPDQRLTDNDVPVMENALCRLRWNRFAHALCVDSWTRTGGWQEQGRWTFWRENGGAHYQFAFYPHLGVSWPTRGDARVVELSREHGVVKITLAFSANANPNRLELYVQLRRGWTGPRLEGYYSGSDFTASNPAGVHMRWSPCPTSGPYDHALPAQQGIVIGGNVAAAGVVESNVQTWNANGSTLSSSHEPYTVLGRAIRDANLGVAPVGFKVATFAHMHIGTQVLLTDDASGYPGFTVRGVSFGSNYGGVQAGYLGIQQGFTAQQYLSLTNGDASGQIVYEARDFLGRALSLSGTEVIEPQTTEAANTLVVGTAQLGYPGRGKYTAWVRGYVTSGTGTIRVGPNGPGSGPATFTNTTAAWIRVGDFDLTDQTSAIYFNIWSTSGGVRLDRFMLLPAERSTWSNTFDPGDGARELARVLLYDGRGEPVLVARA